MVERPADNPYVCDPDTDFEAIETLDEETATEQVQRLRAAINYHDYRYYVENDPVIADGTYDALFDRLESLEAAFDLVDPNSPTQRVGGEPLDELETVEHVRPMLSLESSGDSDEVRAWADRVHDRVGDVRYSVEPKFDGFSVEVVYTDGTLDRVVTRGNGTEGDDVTENARTIHALPLTLPAGGEPPADLVVRAEVFMPRSGFQALNEERVERGEDPFANPRNAAAGTVRQLDPSVVADRPLDLFFYDIMASSETVTTQEAVFDRLAALGLKVCDRNDIVESVDDVLGYRDDLLAVRDDLEYETDGVVVKVDDFDARDVLGSTARHPRWAFAYKFPPRTGETIVRRIVVQVGRTGKLTPVALLDPVEVGGVTISRATLHNASIVAELGVTAGARVRIERAGDVIPEVEAVLEADGEPFAMPETCPVCGSPVEAEGEYHFCTGGVSCPAQLRRSIEHFGAPNAMDIEGLGEKVADQLVESGLVESLADLYDLTVADLRTLDLFGERRADNLLSEIEGSKDVPLDRFLYALGIRHVGSERARDLAATFTLEELMDANESDVEAVEDFGPEVGASVASFFENEQNRAVIERLLDAGVTPERQDGGDELAGLTFVFTGGIEGYTRDEITALLERHGADVTSSVSGETDFLVVGENPGQTKRADARENDVPVIDVREFQDRFLSQIE